MFDDRHYVPILKSKAGELKALETIPVADAAVVTPLLEITPIPPKWIDGEDDPVPSKTIDEHVAALVKKIAKSWTTGTPVFIDGFYVEEDDVLVTSEEPIYGILEGLHSEELSPIPVVGLNRIVEYNDACVKFAKKNSADVCLRLTAEDLSEGQELAAQIDQFLEYLELPPGSVHLIVDYGGVLPDMKGPLKVSLPFMIGMLPSIEGWKSLTFAAGSFPSELEMQQNTTETFARVEWEIWLGLRAAGATIKRIPAFGDYGVSHPSLVELDPRKIRMSPKIKYCDQLQWVVARGEAFRRKGDKKQNVPPAQQYPMLAAMITSHPAWKGAQFSLGDQYIQDCADKKECGNATTWVTVGTSHHAAFVVQQIANLP